MTQKQVRQKHTNGIKHEADETMVGGEWKELCFCKYDVLETGCISIVKSQKATKNATDLEIVDNGLSVQEIIGHGKEVPIESLAPRIAPFDLLFTAWFMVGQSEERRDLPVYK